MGWRQNEIASHAQNFEPPFCWMCTLYFLFPLPFLCLWISWDKKVTQVALKQILPKRFNSGAHLPKQKARWK